MSHKHFLIGLILALLAGGVMLGCNDENPPTAALPDYRPPSVEWIAPSPDADLSGETTLLIAASDDDEVANVAVYLNGQAPDDWRAVGHADSLYSFSWDTRDFPDSFYNLEARAWDASGNLGISPALLVRVANDTTAPPAEDRTAPDVWWTAPDPGNVRGDVELSFRVLDDNPLQRVRLYQNGIMPEGGEIAVNDTGFYSLIWNTLADSDGVYSWEARAWDISGNLGISPALLVRVANDTTAPPVEDRMPPVIAWMSPDPGDTLQSVVNLRFQIIDESPIDTAIVFINGQQWQKLVNLNTFYNGNVIWNTNEMNDGIYLIQVKAVDSAGNVAYSEVIRFTVWNERPRALWVPTEYETIQGAINASEDGDTIMVRAGEYHEQLQFFDKNVSLVSESGPEVTTIDGTGYYTAAWITGGQDTTMLIRGFTFKNNSARLCYCLSSIGASSKIVNNVFLTESQAAVNGIIIGQNNAIIRNNIFIFLRDGIEIAHSFGTDLSNNIFIDIWDWAIFNRAISGQLLIPDYNLIWDCNQIWSEELGEHNITNSEPLFEQQSFHLRNNSPGVNEGRPDILDIDGTRSDIGVYGGPFAY